MSLFRSTLDNTGKVIAESFPERLPMSCLPIGRFPATRPVEPDSDLCLLALQNGLIDQGALFAAFAAWTRDKSRTLADLLEANGTLDADDRGAVEALVSRHVKRNGGDVEKSLAAVPAGRSTRESLARLDDPDINATRGQVASSHGSTEARWPACMGYHDAELRAA